MESTVLSESSTPKSEKTKLNLSGTQVAAGALMTITMSFIGSFLGPQGTIIAGALTSIASTAGTALWQHALVVSGRHAKRLVVRQPGESEQHFRWRERLAAAKKVRMPNRRFAGMTVLLAGGMFFGVMAAYTGVEAAVGKPVSAMVQGKPGNGTTLGGGNVEEPVVMPTSTPTPTVTGRRTPRPTLTPTGPSSYAPTPAPRSSVAPTLEPSGFFTPPPSQPVQPTFGDVQPEEGTSGTN